MTDLPHERNNDNERIALPTKRDALLEKVGRIRRFEKEKGRFLHLGLLYAQKHLKIELCDIFLLSPEEFDQLIDLLVEREKKRIYYILMVPIGGWITAFVWWTDLREFKKLHQQLKFRFGENNLLYELKDYFVAKG